jgi:hypothetical protein
VIDHFYSGDMAMSLNLHGDVSMTTSDKLPFWDTVSLSYSTYFANFIDVLRASWLWMIVAAVFTYFASLQQWTWMASAMANIKPGLPPHAVRPLDMALFIETDNVLVLLAGVSIAVAWHRLMILGEHPGFSGSNLVTKNLWCYILYAIALLLIMASPLLVIMLPFAYLLIPTTSVSTPPAGFFIVGLFAYVLCIVTSVIAIRLSLLLPAQAVGNTNVTFGQAWARSRGNFWRLAWGYAFTTTPMLFVMQIAMLAIVGFPRAAFGGEGFVARMTAMSTVMMVYYLLITPIGIGFLSHAYRHFFMDRSESTNSA